MDELPRHRCLIYTGPPNKQLAGLAATVLAHLRANYRCLYLNSPLMVEGMRAYLTAAGLNVADEEFKKASGARLATKIIYGTACSIRNI